MEKSVAIVVLNYNDRKNTIRYINEIKDYNIISKIVIVDNNSTIKDEFEKLLELSSPKIDVIKSDKNGGYSYGNNFGLKYLEKESKIYDYIIISNPDISVEENSIKKCVEFLENNKDCAVVAPRMHYTNGAARRSAWKKRKPIIDIANSTRLTQFILFPIFKYGEYLKEEYSKDILKVDNISGAFFVADFKKFKEIGFFDDEVFLFYEEDIIGNRLKDKGYSIYSLNNIKFMHYDSRTIGKIFNLFKKQDILFDSRIYYQKKYNHASTFSIILLYILKYFRKLELLIEVPLRKIFKY